MSARYIALRQPLAPDAEHELDAAFESDDEDESRHESAPLNPSSQSAPLNPSSQSARHPLTEARTSHFHDSSTPERSPIPGSYDFEADPFDYAVPPPGSPPGPTTFAIPNQYGNSNGLIPADAAIPKHSQRRTGFFRRVAGALLPSHYQRVPSEEGPQGGGTNNDGVFANMAAKPARGIVIQDGESIHVVPELVQKEVPPSYAAAQADAAPSYFETIVHTPSSGSDGEVLVDAMPTGSIFTFAWTMLISISFQFIGFLLTYLLHTTHAAKYGSRAGLGVTIVQYAFFLRRRAQLSAAAQYEEAKDARLWWGEPDGDSSRAGMNDTMSSIPPDIYPSYFSPATTEWMSFVLMSLGWFVLLTSLLGFWRVKLWERGIRASVPAPMPTTEDPYRGTFSMRVLGRLGLLGVPADSEDEASEGSHGNQESPSAEEIRLTRDLRVSGLL